MSKRTDPTEPKPIPRDHVYDGIEEFELAKPMNRTSSFPESRSPAVCWRPLKVRVGLAGFEPTQGDYSPSRQSQNWFNPSELFNQGGEISYDEPYYNKEIWSGPVQDSQLASTQGQWSDDFEGASSQSGKTVKWDSVQQRWRDQNQQSKSNMLGGGSQWHSSMEQAGQQLSREQIRFEGTIQETQPVASIDQSRTLRRVTLTNGQTQVLDLGPNSEQAQADLQEGKRIQVRGRFAQVSGQQALVAQTAEIDGKKVSIQGSQSSSSAGGGQGQFASGQSGQLQQQGWDRVEGTIEGIREVDLAAPGGGTQKHSIATVRRESGGSVSVYLGQKNEAEKMRLQKGDRIQAKGSEGQVANERVFLADSLTASGQQYPITYASERSAVSQSSGSYAGGSSQGFRSQGQDANQSTFQSQSRGQSMSLAGTIESVRQAQVNDPIQGSQRHTLVQVTGMDGQRQVIDLGAQASVNQMNLETGSRIAVTGRQTQVQGEQAIKAESLEVNGQRIELQAQNRQMSSGRETTIGLQAQQRGARQTVKGSIAGFRTIEVQSESGQTE